MKERLLDFGLYVIVGLFVLGSISTFCGGWLTIIGLSLLGVLGISICIYFKVGASKDRNFERQQKEDLENFKRSAKKILVNLENVEIKSNSWTESVLARQSGYGGLDEMAGYENGDIVKIKRNPNTIKISIPFEGNTIDYSVDIEKDPTTLKMKLLLKKETYLYVSREDKEEMYLDLEFLD